MSDAEPIVFDNDRGQRLAGRLHRAGPDGPAAVVCHGMLADKSSAKHTALAAGLAAADITALRFDFAGRGESAGTLEELTVSGEIADLAAATGALRAAGYGPLGLSGSSLGGTVALLAAARDPEIAAVVTINSPARLDRLFAEVDRAAWERTGHLELPAGRLGFGFCTDAATHDLADAARMAGERLFVLQGAADEVVDPADAGLLADAALCDLLVIEGADHRLTDERHRVTVLKNTIAFLRRRLAYPGS